MTFSFSFSSSSPPSSSSSLSSSPSSSSPLSLSFSSSLPTSKTSSFQIFNAATMLATAAKHLSPSDIWRRKDEKTKERSASERLRDWRTSKGSGETKGSGEMRGVLGSWRVRRQEQPSRADEGGVYGGCMPAEWKLQALYKCLKIDTNNFSTWLVESTYPCSESQLCNESLPPYVTLCREQAKGKSKL